MAHPALHSSVTPSVIRPPSWPALEWLRRISGQCRCAARADLFQACAMFNSDAHTAADAYAAAIFRAVPAGRLSFHCPGSVEVSFDESWLMAMLSAAKRGDDASLTFLLARRLPRHLRRQVGFLVVNLSRALDNFA